MAWSTWASNRSRGYGCLLYSDGGVRICPTAVLPAGDRLDELTAKLRAGDGLSPTVALSTGGV